MVRHEYADHVAALALAALLGRPDTGASNTPEEVAMVANLYAEALAALRYPEAAPVAEFLRVLPHDRGCTLPPDHEGECP